LQDLYHPSELGPASPFTAQLLRLLMLPTLEEMRQEAAKQAAEPLVGVQTPLEYIEGLQVLPLRSRTLPPFTCTNTVLVDGGNGQWALIDPGASAEGSPSLAALLRQRPRAPSIYLTHFHADHCAALSVIAEIRPEAKLYVHAASIGRVPQVLKNTIPLKLPVAPGRLDIWIGKQRLQCLPAPGHTDDHLCFWHPATNTLLAGDHAVGVGSAVLDPSVGSMRQYFATTRALIDLKPKVVIPAHGPLNCLGTEFLTLLLKHRVDREEAILAAVNAGHRELTAITAAAYQDVPPAMLTLAASNAALHLSKLHQEGRLPPGHDWATEFKKAAM
jgi:glyoxylase-like metal-dependent hydrolase (beta-lactamase superfamily II)